MKKAISWIFTFILLIITLLPSAYAQNEKLDVIYFYSPKCLSCRENVKFIDALSDNKDINLIKYDTLNDDCSSIQSGYAKHYNVDTSISLQIPALYFGEYFYPLSPANHNEVLDKINEYTSGSKTFENLNINTDSCINNNVFEDVASNITVGGILLAGLIDGINPCAISMLLVFYSFLMFSDNKKKVVFISSFFIMGMFIANFTFGMGINTFYNLFAGNKYIMIGLYILSILMCIIALTLNSIDLFNHNKSGEVKNQLSDKVKFKMTNVMRKTVFSKYAVIAALFVGFLIGVVELSCTGQIYLPTIVYMISNSEKIFSFTIMLILYNLMFVLPLIIITIIASLVKDTEKLKGTILSNNHIIKIVSNVLFVFILFLLVRQFIMVL